MFRVQFANPHASCRKQLMLATDDGEHERECGRETVIVTIVLVINVSATGMTGAMETSGQQGAPKTPELRSGTVERNLVVAAARK